MNNAIQKWTSMLLIMMMTVLILPFQVHAETSKKDVNDHVFIWENEEIPDEFDIWIKQVADVVVTHTPEIGLTRIEAKNADDLHEIVAQIKARFGEQIEVSGLDPDLEVPISFPLPDINTIEQVDRASQSKKQLQSIVSENMEESLHEQWAWHIEKTTNFGESYKIETGNHQTKIAVIDSGIDYQHPDLKNNIIDMGKSFVPGSETAQDDMGHGTMVAGVIAANGKLKGIGPDLGIIPYKVMGARDGESSWVIQAIIAAAKDNVDVINLSLGSYKSLDQEEDVAIIEAYRRAAKFAKKKGVIVVASAGNEALDLTDPIQVGISKEREGERMVHLPGGGIDHVIAVSATNNQDQISSISNYGRVITFAAPGGEMDMETFNAWCLVTYPTHFPQPQIFKQMGIPEGYMFTAGTSLAAPNVTGSIGVYLAQQKKHKKMNPNKVTNQLIQSTTDIGIEGKDNYFGYGLINLTQVLKKHQNKNEYKKNRYQKAS
ncbi:S8 family serine peptidase [Hazenella sp. IB182357]|uniref:S8 family serine peptidase n=1 Tax=Polycladospora coralii TaxID=2771432 RepID=A0A926RX14_9BACL|nr:S8 family serine peptidase [Polycladospora coralii]MBD1372091.1 S8 family serine peptidase [Polycladospora coralii]MBS7530597.1 S8 family serine peptidase [Polycladospora coralii]